MLYLKQIDNIVTEYPYDISLLYEENSDTSFPADLTDKLLSEYNIYKVKEVERPIYSPVAQVCEEQTPVLVDGEWCQSWVVRNKTQEELNTTKEEEAKNIRNKRDELLTKTDWRVIKATETNTPESAEWLQYREDLRNIPQQQGFPYTVIWPTPPNN